MADTATFTPTVPASNQFQNIDFNAFGSEYASLYGHQVSNLIQRQIYHDIYDAAPKGYFEDLKILRMNGTENWKSDEVFYLEKVWGRTAIVALAVAAAAPQQTITVSAASINIASLDMIVGYPDNTKGTITAIDSNLNTITVRSMTGQTLPAVAINDILSQPSTVQADGIDSISTYMRVEPLERFNFIQMFARATRFGKMEMYKYKMAGTTDYIEVNKKEVRDQFLIDQSNCYWNGERGEVTTTKGKAKTMGGVFPTMQAAGSPNVSTTVANIRAAFEDLVISTEYGAMGQTRFLYATPRRLNDLSQAYKFALTRYTPDSKTAIMPLNAIEVASSRIVLVPVKRFEDPASFPAAFANRMILLDQESIKCCETWGMSVGETADRYTGSSNLNTFKDWWVDGQMSIKQQNPLSGGWLDVS